MPSLLSLLDRLGLARRVLKVEDRLDQAALAPSGGRKKVCHANAYLLHLQGKSSSRSSSWLRRQFSHL